MSARPPARRGRRGGDADTRAEILAVALEHFAAKGYDATSLRGIAREAGVDPALVHHYFEGKSALFAEVIGMPADPAALVSHVLAGPQEHVGEALARTFFSVWDPPEGRMRFQGVIRAAVGFEGASRMVHEFVVREIFGRVAGELAARTGRGADDAALGAGLAAAQVVGVGLLRYVLEVPALVDVEVDELVARLAPVLQRHLVGG
ncbi:TetR/AcrR family transcriptional regulator [Janibacter melonis]|uniref:TetR/AcrR family transcriptional regulator n=1 Tax=Janibacter melonis TaxID=262209 RepID=UPI00174CB1DF|nr:TetR family transcriptional regulator [Janibacter melonis]